MRLLHCVADPLLPLRLETEPLASRFLMAGAPSAIRNSESDPSASDSSRLLIEIGLFSLQPR